MPSPLPNRDTLHRHDGDGWVECTFAPAGADAVVAPHRHWGLFGAAGLMLVRRDADGAVSDVVLQHRAEWSDQGGTWGIPGGAIAADEDAAAGALREAQEEAGIDPAAVRVVATHVLDHGVWAYTTVLGEVADGTTAVPAPTDPESLDARWVPLAEVEALPLMPAFAAALPALLALLDGSAEAGG